MTVIETDRLRLSPVSVHDLDAYFVLSNDALVAATLSFMPHPLTRDRARDLMAEGMIPDGALRKIALRQTGGVVGFAGLHPDETGWAEIGYWLGSSHWGKGYAKEAARALYAEAIGLGWRPWATCLPDNLASAQILLGLGLKPVGRRDVRYRTGVPVREVVVYEAPGQDRR